MSVPSTRIVVQADDQASGVLRNVAGEADNLASHVESAGMRASAALALLGGAALTKSFVDASRNENLASMLETVGVNAGYSSTALDGYVSALRKAGSTGEEARQTLMKLVQAEVELQNVSKLATVAQDAAAVSSTNGADALEKMIRSIKSGQTETLRSIGLQVDYKTAYAESAKQIGVRVSQLTEEQKEQARLNAILEAGEKNFSAYAASAEDASGKISTLSGLIADLSVDFGQLLLLVGDGSGILDVLTHGIEGINAAALAIRGKLTGLSIEELQEAGRTGGLQGMRDLVENAEKAETAVAALKIQLDALDAQGMQTTTLPLRQELDALETSFASGTLRAETFRKAVLSLQAILKATLTQGTTIIAPDIVGDARKSLDDLLENANKTTLKNTEKVRLSNLDTLFDPQINALREATSAWQKGTAEYAKAQDALNAVIAEKKKQRDAILGKGKGGGGGSIDKAASALDSLTAKVEALRGKLSEDKGETFLAGVNKELADMERAAAKLKGTQQQQYQSLMAEYKSLAGQWADQQNQKDLEKVTQVRLDFEREYADMVGLTADAVSKSLQRQYEDYKRSGVDIVQLEEWKRDKIQRASRDAASGMTVAMRDYALDATNAAKNAGEAISNTFSGMEDALVGFVQNGKLKFSSLVNSILADLTRIAVRQTITGPLASGLSSVIGGLFGSIGGSSASSFSWGGSSWSGGYGDFTLGGVSSFHTGGIAGSPSAAGMRTPLPDWLFAEAPRYHSGGIAGLRSNEVPAVLERDEGIFTAEQMARLAPVSALTGEGMSFQPMFNLTIIDQRSTDAPPVQTSQTPNTYGGLDISVLIPAVDAELAAMDARGESLLTRNLKNSLPVNTNMKLYTK